MDPEDDVESSGDPLTWSLLLDAAIRIGLSHDEFWDMTLKEFFRVLRIREEQAQDQRDETRMLTALQTAYLYNVVGSAWYKDFKPLQAGDLFDTWSGKANPEDEIFSPEKYSQAHENLIKRDSWT